MKRFSACLLFLLNLHILQLLIASTAFSQVANSISAEKPASKQWYDQLSLRGYSQIRYNRLLETNENLGCEQCDKSIGKNGGIFIRRARLILSGQVSKRVFVYIQPDFASAAGSTTHYGQLRDLYFDLGIDPLNEFRFRVGQSKVPFGFENLQSSSNRLPLDRADPLNSAAANERDLGVYFMWAPQNKRQLMAMLVKDGLKGSSDYGIFTFGVYNGQTANKNDLNNEPHVLMRITYPFNIRTQIIESSIQAYKGRYTFSTEQISGLAGVKLNRTYLDQRSAASFVLYPKPFGIQAEYNVGQGPEFDKNLDSITVQRLQGGYVTLCYLIQKNNQTVIPFARAQYYDGGKKHELDARSYKVNEIEMGVEWLPIKNFELTMSYCLSSRRYEDGQRQDNLQSGQFLRIQAQFNY